MIGRTYPSKNYGEFKVLTYVNSKCVKIQFITTGYTCWTVKGHTLSGHIRDPYFVNVQGKGFMGEGAYNSTTALGKIYPYTVWGHMLSRCYNRGDNIFKWYGGKGVTVCEEWFNYQNFAQWVERNLPCKTRYYDLDKDVHSIGLASPKYSPDTCALISHEDNIQASHSKEYLFTNPEGVKVKVNNLSKFCKDAKPPLSRPAMSLVVKGERLHHRGWTKFYEGEK